MLYKSDQINHIFPKNDFSFLTNLVLKKILKAVNGRFIGGVVRDALLGIKTNDIDISTVFQPLEVIEILKKLNFNPIGTGIIYGTVSVFLKDLKIEITSLRKDVKNYGRRAEVLFGGTWEEDSLRRDFTFNALYLEPVENSYIIYDYHEGLKHLHEGKVKFIGNYKERIQEDYLRIMRFIRFFLRYSKNQDYIIEIEILREFVKDMKILSIERILMEIDNILKCNNWDLGIEIMNYLGISNLFFLQDLFRSQDVLLYSLSLDERFFVIFHKISLKIINQLPLQKYKQKFLQYYINSDFSSKSLANVWQKTKSLTLVQQILYIRKIIYKDLNYKTELLEENLFNSYKSNYKFINSTGLLRGQEELLLKIEYLQKCLLFILYFYVGDIILF